MMTVNFVFVIKFEIIIKVHHTLSLSLLGSYLKQQVTSRQDGW